MNLNLEKTSATAVEKRQAYYKMISEQLDNLYHDIDSGKFGNDAKTGDFYLGRKAVKDKYPK
ncbi:hypothetical protein OAG26_01005 [Flavobacteriales bacterium]|nr:hypothetical protein [Flavobacteriales bacterium]